jgi:hypothetical protein
MFSSALCSQTPLVYVPPLLSRDQVSHPNRTNPNLKWCPFRWVSCK